jgi:protein gp37
MDHAWAREIRDQCVAAGVAFFFKQSAAYHTEKGKALLEEDGSAQTWQQFPRIL